MNRNKVIIIGGLGNGSVIAAAIHDANDKGYDKYEVGGYLNDREEVGSEIEGFKVLGKLRDIQKFIEDGYSFIYTIYRIDGQEKRLEIFEGLNVPEDQLAIFVHPSVYLASNVKLSSGCVLMPNVSISPGASFGKCCLVMVNASFGHNSGCGDFCHFAAQSCIGAYCKIGKGVHIGLNATVRENLNLKNYSALGMGSVLLKDIGEKEIWGGVPASLIRYSKNGEK